MSPQGPCFEAGPGGYFFFQPQFSSTRRWTALGAFSEFVEQSTVFDGTGKKWQARSVEAPFKKSWWRVLLANTVYNPRIVVTVLWREPKPFDLEELKLAYSKAVDQDDDILTQFVGAEELKKKIAGAQSFDSLVQVYCWMKTDPSDVGRGK